MKILDLLKKAKERVNEVLQGPPQEPKSKFQIAEDNKNPFRRRKIPPLMGWYKKDNAFVRKDMGLMKPPKEDEAYFKAKGWVKKKLKGEPAQKPSAEKPESNVGSLQDRDQDIDSFLSDLIKPDSNPHLKKPSGKA